MRVKHWAGYGCVEAKCNLRHKIASTGYGVVTIEVTGNHEYGLLPRYFDNNDWMRWLGKRFHLDPIYEVITDEFWSNKDKQGHLIVTFHTQEVRNA